MSKLIAFAKFSKKDIALGGPIAIHGFVEKRRKGRGKEKEKKGGNAEERNRRKGSICGLGLLVEQWAKASLGVSLRLSLACTQLCAKQLQMWRLCRITGITLGGTHRYTALHCATQCLAHFPDPRELSFT